MSICLSHQIPFNDPSADWADVRTVGKGCYRRKLMAFLNMIEAGQEAIPLEHTLELTQALIMAEKSIESGKREWLQPIEEIMLSR